MRADDIKKIWIIDASFAAAVFLPDEGDRQVDSFFNTGFEKFNMLVPPLWWYEISSVLTINIRRHRISKQQALEAIDMLSSFPLQVTPKINAVGAQQLMDLALQHNLSAYDAAYLDLAVQQQASLATLDKQLTAAAKQLGLGVWF